MNRPTIDVDDLLEMADEAIAAGDQQQAVAILRKAAAVAPLRRDIRNRLALVLEGTPVPPRKTNRRLAVAEVKSNFDDYPEQSEFEATDDDASAAMDSISQIARKAFDAAAQQKAKAGVATRRLTNLLQTGLDNWKSSLAAQIASTEKGNRDAGAATAQSIVFHPEEELKQYLERANISSNTAKSDMADQLEAEADDEVASEIVRPATISRKAARSGQNGKTARKRPTDVEDVLAAGIGGFIEAVGRMDKSKIVFGLVYVALIGLFGYACFDVSQKFPGLKNGNAELQSASIAAGSNIQLAENMNSDEAIAESKKLLSAGKTNQAIAILRAQLESGRLLHNRDLIRVELATVLNDQAESHLKANRLDESVKSYREALSYLPNDARLQLRLANALYYGGMMGVEDENAKKKMLEESDSLLSSILSRDKDDIQAHRLMALVHDARGEKNLARIAWQKVKSLAPADSSILVEAKEHLK